MPHSLAWALHRFRAGLYVSANAWEPYVEAHVRDLSLLDHVSFLTTNDLRQGGNHDPAALARAWWPQAETADGYRRTRRRVHARDGARPTAAARTAPTALARHTRPRTLRAVLFGDAARQVTASG
ncbi:hypothetical protein ACWGCP_16570 [Streptomyces niveus]